MEFKRRAGGVVSKRREVGDENKALERSFRARLMPRLQSGVVEYQPRDPDKCSFCGAPSYSEFPNHSACLTCGMEKR